MSSLRVPEAVWRLTLELRINSMTRLSYGAKPTTCAVRVVVVVRAGQKGESGRKTDLADDRLDERGALGLLSLAVRGLDRLGDDGGRVSAVEAPGEV